MVNWRWHSKWSQRRRDQFERLASAYRSISLIASNALLLFVALNLAIAAISYVRQFVPAHSNPVAGKYAEAKLRLAYPDKGAEEIRDLLEETWSRPYLYEPFTQFKERPSSGRYVNVSEEGYRFSGNQAPWPPDPTKFTVFVFGGSTTFGYGVADHDTVPSHLQVHLRERLDMPVAVFNFGRGFYYSTQERILFEQLLVRGYRPKLAIFIDGLNEFYHTRDEPLLTPRVRAHVEAPITSGLEELLRMLPAFRAARRLAEWNESRREKATPNANVVPGIIQRYLANKRIIEAVGLAYGIRTLFVWQPVPTYKYDQAAHLFSVDGMHSLSADGYRGMAAVRETLGRNFLWCADIQEGRKEPLYVDQVHYTGAFSKAFALCIANSVMPM